MKTEDLNGHYCLATKANYDKLVEDGIGTIFSSLEEQRTRNDGKYIIVIDNVILLVWAINNHEVPMHLENNEWVEGSLEHIRTKEEIEDNGFESQDEIDRYFKNLHSKKEFHKMIREPKPAVERITRESFNTKIRELNLAMLEKGEHGDYIYKSSVYFEIRELLDYIEYLESNQKKAKCKQE